MVTIASSFTRGKRWHAGQALTCIAWSPHGRSLAVAGDAAEVEVWDVQTGSVSSTYTGHTDIVTSKLVACGRYIASASRDGTVQIWNAATGTTERLLRQSASIHVMHAWSPDGSTLAWAGSDWIIYVWDLRTSRPVGVLSDPLAVSSRFTGLTIVVTSLLVARWPCTCIGCADAPTPTHLLSNTTTPLHLCRRWSAR